MKPACTWTLSDPVVLTSANGGTLMLSITNPVGDVTTNFYNRRMQVTGVARANGTLLTNLYGTDGFLSKSIEVEAESTNAFACQFAGKTSQGVAGENRPLMR